MVETSLAIEAIKTPDPACSAGSLHRVGLNREECGRIKDRATGASVGVHCSKAWKPHRHAFSLLGTFALNCLIYWSR